MNAPDTRNLNSLWASVFVESLVCCGVRQAVISPGSRSTPLVMALVGHPGMETLPVLDERSGSFFALGLAKRGFRPVVFVCTSGTAAANAFPAVIEAKESGVPLIVVTADRPPELRSCASGQTIDQQKLFGGYPNFYHELAVPDSTLPMLSYLRQTTVHAVRRSVEPFSGPVHLNMPFQDPLAPVSDGGAAERAVKSVKWGGFFSHLSEPAPTPVNARVELTGSGVIIAGPHASRDPEGHSRAVSALAAKLGWPVLADALSPIRNHGFESGQLVTTYDAILRNEPAAASLRPETILLLGEWPTSKVLRAWIEASDPLIHWVGERFDNRDALHGRTRCVRSTVEGLEGVISGARTSESADRWARLERAVRSRLDAVLKKEGALVEPKAAWILSGSLPKGTPLYIANSMPIRDMEYIWPLNSRGIQPFFNRGANGIDGTLSTALGIAHGHQPAVLLTGDLALLHDSNGFLIRPKLKGSLTIVLINNRGGGIFNHLPIAQFNPPFEEYFATPQEADFGKLAAAYGVEHHLIRDWAHFQSLIAKLPESGIRILELTTDRVADAAWRKKLFLELSAPA